MSPDPLAHDICVMCNNTREWHASHFARHAFSMIATELRDTSRPARRAQTQSERGITHTSMPFDPVLRMALIQKGVITLDDIHAAERLINVLSDQVNETIGEQGAGEHASVDADARSGEGQPRAGE